MNAITTNATLANGTPIYLRGSSGFIVDYKPNLSAGRSFMITSPSRPIMGDYVILWETGRISELPDTMTRDAAGEAARCNFDHVLNHVELYQRAKIAANDARAKAEREREEYNAKAAAFKAEAEARAPTWAKAVIVAELMQDECDSMSDYFHSRCVRTVILAWSRHERDLFPEMRAAALNFSETVHLSGGPESFEHREKYSMGGGYFLKNGSNYRDGWRVKKAQFYGEGPGQTPMGEWSLAPDVPAIASPAKVAGPVAADGFTITEHTHTKKGFQMFICSMSARVERAEFERLRDAAEALGGWYSKPWAGTPGGFAFKRKADAEAFASPSPSEALPADEPDAPKVAAAPSRQGTGDKLRALADGMQKDIDHAFRDRNANTPKRQREAQSARLEGLQLTRAQAGLRALAGLADAGDVPLILAGVTSRKVACDMARADIIRQGGYYDAGHESGKPALDTDAARLFWSLAADAGKAEKEKFALKNKIEALQFANIPGYFPTPRAVAARMLELADIEPGALVLEPSAGHGSILDAIKAAHPGARLVAYERHYSLADIIAAKGYTVDRCDFTEQTPEPVYDCVMMNPPFESGQDMQHVRHAFAFLKPGGRLVAVMSPGPFFRQDKAACAFRDWFDGMAGEREELPAGSFKESGTGAGAVLVTISKGAA
jgi:phospholipid N-methyltransferase